MLANQICLHYELSALRILTFSNIVLFYNSVHRTVSLACITIKFLCQKLGLAAGMTSDTLTRLKTAVSLLKNGFGCMFWIVYWIEGWFIIKVYIHVYQKI